MRIMLRARFLCWLHLMERGNWAIICFLTIAVLASTLFFAFGGSAFAAYKSESIPPVPAFASSSLLQFPRNWKEREAKPTAMHSLGEHVLVPDVSNKNMLSGSERANEVIYRNPCYRIGWHCPIVWKNFPLPVSLPKPFRKSLAVQKFVPDFLDDCGHTPDVSLGECNDKRTIISQIRRTVAEKDIRSLDSFGRILTTSFGDPADDDQTISEKYKRPISNLGVFAEYFGTPSILARVMGFIFAAIGWVLFSEADGMLRCFGAILLPTGIAVLIYGTGILYFLWACRLALI